MTHTIHYHGLRLQIADRVYEPAEDSYLLADAVREAAPAGRVLDVGTGTGLVALIAARTAADVTGVDVNIHAVELARYNATLNEIENVEVMESDLFSRVEGAYDFVSFNPPYLPVDEGDELGKAWSGGERGREVIDRFLEDVGAHLTPAGCFLLLVSSLNDIDDVKGYAEKKGFAYQVVSRRKLDFEELVVFKGIRGE